MKTITIVVVLIMTVVTVFAQQSFYDFKVKTIDGENFDLASLKGKKVLVVNTASKCGLTGQYEQLQEIYKKYGNEKFTIIGFPANNFMKQEPGTNAEIEEFCTKNYGVTFQMMEKISVKGDDMHPLYQWLTAKSKNGVLDSEVGWNFQKYLIDEKGNLAKMVAPKVKPDNTEIVSWISE